MMWDSATPPGRAGWPMARALRRTKELVIGYSSRSVAMKTRRGMNHRDTEGTEKAKRQRGRGKQHHESTKGRKHERMQEREHPEGRACSPTFLLLFFVFSLFR